MMKTTQGKAVLITGASAGIGKATALYLAQRGHRVAATGRSMERLKPLAQEAQGLAGPLYVFQLNVNDPGSVSQVVPAVIDQLGGLDVLVNNAGYGLLGCLEDLSVNELKAQFETNFFAVHSMTQSVLSHMRQQGRGTIINIGSVSGLIGSPGGGAYASSKAALRALTAVLRLELKQFGIAASLIEPGVVRTDFHRNEVLAQRAQDPSSPYKAYLDRIRGASSRFHLRGGEASGVARRVERIMTSRHPRPRYSVGIDAGLGAMAVRLLPDRVLEFFLRRVLSG